MKDEKETPPSGARKRNFEGSKDESAIIIDRLFPGSDLVVSVPFWFEGKRSGVYIEGKIAHLELLFPFLGQLIDVYNEERFAGRWIGLTPPDEHASRMIIHYEAIRGGLDKIQLLNFLFRKHLAEVCNIRLAKISRLIVRSEGEVLQSDFIALPKDFQNGEEFLIPPPKDGGGKIFLA